MSDSAKSSAGQKASDLVRVRDNQRRSRARKKEYVQELETKWRTCEQTGAEASAEIQAAARKVADENKRLRQLLAEHGIPDRETNSPLSQHAVVLDSLLGTRRRCGTHGNGSCKPATPIVASSVPPQNSGEPSSHANIRPAARTLRPQAEYSPSPAYASSSTGVSSNNLTMSIYTGNPHHPTVAQQPPENTYYSPPVSDRHLGSFQGYGFAPSDYAPDSTMAGSETSSCRAVADAIRYVRPNLGPDQLEAQMGCSEGQDCSISNVQAFDLMDRLSDGRDQ